MGAQSRPGGDTNSLMGGGLLTPEAVGPHASIQQSAGGQADFSLTSDVDSSLVRAAESLSELCETTETEEGVWPSWGCAVLNTFSEHYFPHRSQYWRQNRNGEKVR